MERLTDIIGQHQPYNFESLPTPWPSLNTIIGGGWPCGRIVEIYGPHSMGKSSLAIASFPDTLPVLYLDVDRKLCPDYVVGRDNLVLDQGINNEELISVILTACPKDIGIVVDSLPMVGSHITDDSERFRWLSLSFARIQRALVVTKSVLIVVNQIRVVPATGAVYNPHEGCIDPALKLKMHTAEKRGDDKLVYVDIEKSFWGHEGERCTLLVSKTEVRERR